MAVAVTRRLRWWLTGAVGVGAMTAVAVWFGVAAASGKVNWVNTGFEVVADNEVDVRFDLHRDPDRPVRCVIEAQDEQHFVVGRTTTRVAAASRSPSRHVATVRTAAPAVTGYVDTCEYLDAQP
ncbi:MAG TPA: DUF4307 domain-containing protein [Ornithinimicrobium sp.]|uniref:DUF4307 domain-containing protein n=1 Tax=Ornithinimicrobium sp. TaxID=1977084 RepID=UPI002B472987|nr:DUF4307 domain-containing protein [Ornithinimicrobium sp.]HKJ13115.1 DUF4307 domain-containing protein [Ornithinimicrobium sp.]